MIGMICVFNQLERDLIQQRTKDNLSNRRERVGDKPAGRKPMSKYKRDQAFRMYDGLELDEKGKKLSINRICKEVGISHRTLYNWLEQRKQKEHIERLSGGEADN